MRKTVVGASVALLLTLSAGAALAGDGGSCAEDHALNALNCTDVTVTDVVDSDNLLTGGDDVLNLLGE